MPNFISDIMGTLTRSDFILPNGVWLLIAFGFIWLLLKRKKDEGFKRKDTTKEIKAEFNALFKMFQIPVGKRLDWGFSKSRFIISYIPVYWDKNIDIQANIRDERRLRRYLKSNPEKKAEDGKLKKEYEDMIILKTVGHKPLDKVVDNLLGRASFMIVPREMVDMTKEVVVLDPKAVPLYEFGTVFFNKSGRNFIENVAYKLNRENELDELVNQIPKQNYLEVSTSSVVARAREKAQIEKEKYKGQIEGAEEG